MALVMEANYSKKLGLPGYSSHQFMVTVRMELGDINQVAAESSRLYALLQSAVDKEIQRTGFLPANGYPVPIGKLNGNGSNGYENGKARFIPQANGNGEAWACSDKQRDLIIRIVDENRLDKKAVDQLAQERFGKGVRQLNKLEASGFIEELIEQNGGNNGQNRLRNHQKAGAR